MTPFRAADYMARRGWPVFPWGRRGPLTPHGQNDATTDVAIVREWWSGWPEATPAVQTGAAAGLIALDIDIGHGDAPTASMAST